FQGSENFDHEYLPYLQELGATDLNGTTWFDRTNYFQTVPKNALDTVLWLESDRMGHFAESISQAKLDEQRGVVQNEKRQGDNQPYGKVWETILPQVFPPGHPYSWDTIGSMEDLDAATVEDARNWFRTWYGPNNAVLVIAGDVQTDAVFEHVQRYFGDIPPGPPLARPQRWIPELARERRVVMTDRVPQARLYMAWPGPAWGSRDAHYLRMAADILGSGKNSRLYQRLVYSDQIATDIDVSPLAMEIAGITALTASAQPGVDLDQIESAIREELQRFIDKGPTRRELERTQVQLRATFLQGIERVGGTTGKSGVLAKGMVYAGRPDAYRQLLDDIEQATVKDIRAAAARWLGAGRLVLSVEPYPELRADPPEVDRSAGPPEPGEFPAVHFTPFERHRLENGLDVIIARRPDVPLVEIGLIVDAGFAADQFARPGTSTLTMAMLDEGTKSRSALQISEQLARLGARLDGHSSLDSSLLSMSALSENLDASLEIFADVALNPVFPQQELDRQRRIGLARIRQEQNHPVTMALRIMPGLLYGTGHPYAQPLTGSGTEADLKAMTRDELVAFHQTWFKPDNASLVVVGDVDADTLMPELDELFGRWQTGPVPAKQLDVTAIDRPRVLYLLDRPEADQSVIFAGELIPPKANPDETAIQALNDILGGLSSSRINMNLRENKHWSYGAYSLILDARGKRPWLAYAPVQTDKTRESVEEMLHEIRAIRSERPVTPAELQTAIRSETLSLAGRWEDNASVLSSLDELVSFGLPDDYWDHYSGRVSSLQLSDVQRIASGLLNPDRLVWVVVGDRARIEAGLRTLGFDELRLIDANGNPIASELPEKTASGP
ncbi:MAG TPA: insulinase family protein, partial [Chromatiales bacterium]|nr:insulinase family protein [Chromatiales bacterium]